MSEFSIFVFKFRLMTTSLRLIFFFGCLLSLCTLRSQNLFFTANNVTSSALNGTWTVPSNVTQIRVQCWGGGGGGGGATGQAAAGGGGGGGAYTENEFSVSPGQSFNYSVGNGGVSSFSVGGAGGNTWFDSSVTLLARGGNGGNGQANNFATAFGAAAVNSGNIGGLINYYGGAGGTGTNGANGSMAGGGGGSGGSLGNGTSGAGRQGGNGGAGESGNGAWAGTVGCDCNGSIGFVPGGGGSGGQASGVADKFSGPGGGGRIAISYTIPGIGGRVYADQNQDCFDNTELGISGVRVLLEPLNLITETNASGYYAFNFIQPGQYNIIVDTSYLNTNYCLSQIAVNYIDQNLFTEVQPIGLQSTIQCSSPNISITAPTLRRCFSNQTIYVSACNRNPATLPLNNAYVDILLDPLIIVNVSTLPYTLIGVNTYRFQLGNLAPGSCLDFQLSTTVSCNALMGQTICMEAVLYPTESCSFPSVNQGDFNPFLPENDGSSPVSGLPVPCALPWDQSSLSVNGWCANDTVYFEINNTGDPIDGDMECYSPILVYVDGVLMYTDSLMLTGGQSFTYSFLGNGQTWILQALQHPLHPGFSLPNAHVEACGDINNWNPDIINTFPQDDGNPDIDIYCGIVTTSYDPNDKQGFPNGFSADHFIWPNQKIDYLIRFQNTGNDTAFTVVLRDTLDINFDIFSVVPGVSSHQYDFRIYGPRVLEWTYNNILLPDSTTNESESNGFATFTVFQKPNLQEGIVLRNKADIYFDFNDPIITNETWHTIYDGIFAILGSDEINFNQIKLKAYPNPTNGFLIIENLDLIESKFYIYSQIGTLVASDKLSGEKTTLNLSSLDSGVYFIKFEYAKFKSIQIIKF